MGVVQAGQQQVDVDRYLDDPRCLSDSLSAIRSTGGHALCHCTAPPRRLVVRKVGAKFFLAVWPDDGPNHDFACAFYRQVHEAAQGASEPDRDAGDEATKFTPAFALQRAPDAPRRQVSEAGQATDPHAGADAVSVTALLNMLWAGSRLNCWAPRWTRDWWRVRREIYRSIDQWELGSLPMSNQLYVPLPFRRDAANEAAEREWSQFVSDLAHHRNAVPRRLLLSEVKSLERSSFGFKLDLKHVPWPVFMSREQWEHLQACYARALAGISRQSSPQVKLVALVLIEAAASGKHYFAMCEAAMIMTNANWVPAHTTAELRLADHLVDQQRAFTRPMGADDAAPATPDFWLHDAAGDKPLAIEVLGVDAVPYRERKLRRAALLREHGHPTWVWDATSEDPLLPPVHREAKP